MVAERSSKSSAAISKQQTLSILLVVAGIGLAAVALVDWIAYGSFILSLSWR